MKIVIEFPDAEADEYCAALIASRGLPCPEDKALREEMAAQFLCDWVESRVVSLRKEQLIESALAGANVRAQGLKVTTETVR